MFMKKVEGSGTILLPDGSRMSLGDLPAPDTKRWVASRKAAVVRAVVGGLISKEEAVKTYSLSPEEFDAWQRAVQDHGEKALKTTRLQVYRQSDSP